jgi:hypothetical protein
MRVQLFSEALHLDIFEKPEIKKQAFDRGRIPSGGANIGT